MKKFGWMGLVVGLAWMVTASEADAGHRHRAKRHGHCRRASVQTYQAPAACCNVGYSGYSGSHGHHHGYASPAYSGGYSSGIPMSSSYNTVGYRTSGQSGCGCGSSMGSTGYASQSQYGMSSPSGVNPYIAVPVGN